LATEPVQPDAPNEDVDRAEDLIRESFRKDLYDQMKGGPADAATAGERLGQEDRIRDALAEKAVREYVAKTATDPSLPRLSKVQYLQIRHRLYVAHGPLGPLGDLLQIEGVEDIHINGTRGGELDFGDHKEPLPGRFASEDELIQIVQRYAEQAGRHIDVGSPVVTVTLRDGSRLNAVFPPVAKPMVITIRKHQLGRFRELEDFAREGAMPDEAVPLLRAAVQAGLNILISGRTGAGKTTIARTLGLEIPDGERTCILETETELWLHELRDDFFSLEARDANVEGAGEVTLEQLFQLAALRQRPKRIIVGEVRGREAEPMLHAMASGHDGSITTIHASSARHALARLEVLASGSGSAVSPRLVQHMIATGVDMVLQVGRYRRLGRDVRRLTTLSLVAENQERPEDGPVLLNLARYRLANDRWEWAWENLADAPEKIQDKFEVAGIDIRKLAVRVVPDA
jgi:pilus assembly protein CpaF